MADLEIQKLIDAELVYVNGSPRFYIQKVGYNWVVKPWGLNKEKRFGSYKKALSYVKKELNVT